MNKRISRMEVIIKTLEKVIDKGKKEEFEKANLVAELVVKFGVSWRIAQEDVNAAMIYLRW
jgi:hypothetical protein